MHDAPEPELAPRCSEEEESEQQQKLFLSLSIVERFHAMDPNNKQSTVSDVAIVQGKTRSFPFVLACHPIKNAFYYTVLYIDEVRVHIIIGPCLYSAAYTSACIHCDCISHFSAIISALFSFVFEVSDLR